MRYPAIKHISASLLLLLSSAHAETNNTVLATTALQKLIKVETISPHEIKDSLRLSARIELNHQRTARIGSSVTGRITEINAVLGQTVKRGQSLALLNSIELGKAQSDYLKASSQVNLRQLSTQRAERLFQSDVISTAELQERQGVLKEAQVDLLTARDQLRVMGMSESDLTRLSKDHNIHSFSNVAASIDGVVVESQITLGQVVQPADSLYTVSDLSQLWIVAEVPEQQAHWAREGDQAQAEVSALPGQEVSGKLIYVADMVNPETRTVIVRMALANPDRLFKPQMLATLKISKPGLQSLTVPSKAIIRDNDQDFIFVQSAENRFELRPVSLGREESGVRQLLNGLKNDEKIVVEGAFHLNNERLRSTLE